MRKQLSKNFTNEQIMEVIDLRDSEYSWNDIASILNAKWKMNHSLHVYVGLYRRFADIIKDALENEEHPHSDFTRAALGVIFKENKRKKRRFFISSVVAAAELNVKAFNSVLSYCEHNKAELVLLPMRAHVRALQSQPLHYDELLKPYKDKNFVTEYKFNNRIKALELQINPQQIIPLTGLQRIRGRSEEILSKNSEIEQMLLMNDNKLSVVVAHTKQMMEVLPTGNDSIPRILHSTGALTNPNYQKNRIGLMAHEDHVLGGIILEIDVDDAFYIRQVQINPKNGTFVDLGVRYYPTGRTKQERAEGFVMGDLHPGFHDDKVIETWFDVWKSIKPKNVFLHDFFDGHSVSHHLINKNISKALRSQQFKNLEEEFEMCKNLLYKIKDKAPKDCKVYTVASNHPDHLERYLEDGRYLKDCAENYKLGHYLIVSALEGRNFLQEYIDPDSRLVWLDREDDLIIEGTQCSYHGDLGMNGSRGSNKMAEKIFSSAMMGHTHTPSIYHDLYTVGHSSVARHGYNRGASTWLNCSGIIYKGGGKQLIIVIKNKWKL